MTTKQDSEKPEQLTPKQESFARCVASGMSQADAYRSAFDVRAGTKDSSIHVSASKLMDDPKVTQRVEQLKQPIAQKAQITLESHLQELKELRDDAKAAGNLKAAISAEVARGRAAGLYTEKLQLSGTISTQTEEQRLARIAELEAKRNK